MNTPLALKDAVSHGWSQVSPLKLLLLTGLVLLCMTMPAAADVTPADLTVVNFTMYPQTLMPGDSGIASITLMNTGSTFAPISKAMIKDSDGIEATMSDYYNGNLGGLAPGNTITITLPVKAGQKTGAFYPVFYIDFNDGISALKFPFAVIIDDSGLDISLTDVPDTFSSTSTEAVTLTIGNYMKNDAESVSVTVTGDGVSCKEQNVYVGYLPVGTAKLVNLTVKTEDAKEVTFLVTYSNGANKHTEKLTIPAGTGSSLTTPELIITNIKVTKTNGYYTLNADINNAGFSTANALRITSENSQDVGPYSVYVVGSLDDDDLAGFELSFSEPANGILTLVISYKNDSGELITETFKINVANHLVEKTDSTPVVIGVIAVLVIIAVIIFVISRNKKGKKAANGR